MGEWYGLRDKALVTLSFDEDGTFSITSESNSNYDIQGNYVWDKSAMTVDLPQTTNGMGAAGLYRFNREAWQPGAALDSRTGSLPLHQYLFLFEP